MLTVVIVAVQEPQERIFLFLIYSFRRHLPSSLMTYPMVRVLEVTLILPKIQEGINRGKTKASTLKVQVISQLQWKEKLLILQELLGLKKVGTFPWRLG
jgi:hypothetical protein